MDTLKRGVVLKDMANNGSYTLKANLLDTYIDEKGRLILSFEKRDRPDISVTILKEMKGYLVTDFKKAWYRETKP